MSSNLTASAKFLKIALHREGHFFISIARMSHAIGGKAVSMLAVPQRTRSGRGFAAAHETVLPRAASPDPFVFPRGIFVSI